MSVVEIKANIFDLLKELEQLQTKANEVNAKKNDLLKQLEAEDAATRG